MKKIMLGLFIFLGMICLFSAERVYAEAKGTIIFIPHDSRPISNKHTADTVRKLGYRVLVPPQELLGGRSFLGDSDGLWQWLETTTYELKRQNKEELKGVVLSGDSLIYGSLVASRKHNISSEVLLQRVNRFKEFQKNHPMVKMYVFSSIMRTPRTGEASGSEEPGYYFSYGADIFRYTALIDKKETEGLNRREKKEFEFLTELIPKEALEDWMTRRNKNFIVNKRLMDFTKEGVFSYFCLGRDDNAPFSQTHLESRYLNEYGYELGKTRFNNMAGIDEFGMLLLTRAVNDAENKIPFVYVKYNWGEGGRTIPAYSDEAIDKTIRSHAIMAGGIYVTVPDRADLFLLVNTDPGGVTREANFIENQVLSTATATYCANMAQEELEKGRPVAIADITYANGSDNSLIAELSKRDLLFKLKAYSGWNTPTNSTGFALGQGMLAGAMDEEAIHSLLYTRYLDDWAYQANVRQRVAEKLASMPGDGGYGELNDKLLPAAELTKRLLRSYALKALPEYKDIRNLQVNFPWNRMFEADIDFNE